MPLINPHEVSPEFRTETDEFIEWNEREVAFALPVSLMLCLVPLMLYFALSESGDSGLALHASLILGGPSLIIGLLYIPGIFFRRTIRIEKIKRKVLVDTFSIFTGSVKKELELSDQSFELKKKFYLKSHGTRFYHAIVFSMLEHDVVIDHFHSIEQASESYQKLQLKMNPKNSNNKGSCRLSPRKSD